MAAFDSRINYCQHILDQWVFIRLNVGEKSLRAIQYFDESEKQKGIVCNTFKLQTILKTEKIDQNMSGWAMSPGETNK